MGSPVINGLGPVPVAKSKPSGFNGLGPVPKKLTPKVPSPDATKAPAVAPVGDLLSPGNIDVNHRPVHWGPSGQPSTIYSTTIPVDEQGNYWKGDYNKAPRYALVPTLANGKFLKPGDTGDPKKGQNPDKFYGPDGKETYLEDVAAEHYSKTKEHLGLFKTSKAADEYAKRTHAWMPTGGDEKIYSPSYSGESNMPLSRREYEQALKKPTQAPALQGGGVSQVLPKLPHHQTQAGPGQPGYFKRLGQGLGIPTTKEELIASQPSMTDVAMGPIGTAGKMITSYGKTAAKGIAEGYHEAGQAINNIEEGGPLKANAGKALYGIIHAALQSTPVVGPTIETYAEDVGNKNYAGAAGGATAVLINTLLAKVGPEKIPEVVETTTKMFPKEVVAEATNLDLRRSTKALKGYTENAIQRAQNEGVGKVVKTISDADAAETTLTGTPAATDVDVATRLKQAVQDKRVGKVVGGVFKQTEATPQTGAAAKALARYGKTFTWENLKDLRTKVYYLGENAVGKDKAILGQFGAELDTMSEARAKSIGQGAAHEQYTKLTKDLNEHKVGIVKDLFAQGDSGLVTMKKLFKESNRPQLNELFKILEDHGGVPKGFLEDFLKNHKNRYIYAAQNEGTTVGGIKGSRMSALIRHPKFTWPASALASAAFGVISDFSPVAMGGSFVAGLIAAAKAAELSDRYLAVSEGLKAKGGTGVPRGIPAFPKPSGATPPSPGPVAPSGTPVSPTTPSGPASPVGVAPASAGAPAAPASLDDFMSRVSEASKRQQAASEAQAAGPNPNAALPPERVAELEAQANLGRGGKLSPDAAIAADRLELERRSASGEGIPRAASETAPAAPAKQTPYEKFGVKVDKTKLTTPEEVRAAKADGTEQIQELARVRAKEITKMPAGPESASALKQLSKDIIEAKRSLDKMQTPEIGRKGRDRLRKRATGLKAGKLAASENLDSPEGDPLENLNPEGVTQKFAGEITPLEESIFLQLEAEKAGPMVLKAANQILDEAGGDDATAVPRLRALMEHVRKAKKLSGFDPIIQELGNHKIPEGGWSTENLQKKFGVGYQRATRILNELQTGRPGKDD